MKTFKVLDPNGVHFNGAHYAKGETLATATPLSAAAQAFLHFKQVEEVEAKAAEEEPAKDPAEPPKEPESKGKGGK